MTPAELRVWQARMGYTQYQAAEALGVARRTYQGWCAAQKDAPLARIVELACAQLEHQAQKWEKA